MAKIIEKIYSEINELKAKIYSIVGVFLQNEIKILQCENIVKTLNINEKLRLEIVNRINYLKTNQKNLNDALNDFTKRMDTFIEKIKVFINSNLSVLLNAPKSFEYINKLIGEGKSLIEIGTKLITSITLQNKDVENLEKYLRDKTKVGQIEIPKLETITTSIFKPLTLPLTIFLGLLAVGYMFPNIAKGLRGK